MSYSADEQLIKKILGAIINSTAGLKYAIIVDDTGISIMSVSKFNISEEELSVDKIGAIGGAVFMAGEEQGHLLGYGDINLQITEYKKGMIFSVKAGQATLCLATDKNVQIGFVRATLKKWAPKLRVILDKYLQTDQEVINKELRELFDTSALSF